MEHDAEPCPGAEVGRAGRQVAESRVERVVEPALDAVVGGVDLLDFAVLQAAFSPWSRITEMSPANAEDVVGLTRETIITIPNGVDAATVSNDNVFATFG